MISSSTPAAGDMLGEFGHDLLVQGVAHDALCRAAASRAILRSQGTVRSSHRRSRRKKGSTSPGASPCRAASWRSRSRRASSDLRASSMLMVTRAGPLGGAHGAASAGA